MRPLTTREKRTVRFAAVGIGSYLVLFGGVQAWKFFEKKRVAYQKLVQDARSLRQQIQPYQDKAAITKKLMEGFHLDPAKLAEKPKAAVLAEASAAIQKAAMTSGVQVASVREEHARPSAQELASMRLEGAGPVPAVLVFLHRMESLGYPLIVDEVQITSEPMRPGQLKVSLSIVILDFEQWKNQEPAHA